MATTLQELREDMEAVMLLTAWARRAMLASVAVCILWLVCAGVVASCASKDSPTAPPEAVADTSGFRVACVDSSGWGVCVLAHFEYATQRWVWHASFGTCTECRDLARWSGTQWGTWLSLSADTTGYSVSKALTIGEGQ